MKNFSISLFIVLLYSGCNERFPYETGTFPEMEVKNLLELNTEFDDMNSDYNSPFIDAGVSLIFSSNSQSKGGTFDFINRDLLFIWDKEKGVLTYNSLSNTEVFRTVRNQIFELNTDCNEKGPYSFTSLQENVFKPYMLFSRDCSGFFKIWGSSFRSRGPFDGFEAIEFEVQLMDSPSNEMYPSFYGKDFVKGINSEEDAKEKLLFSSDRDGNFDIFEVTIPSNQALVEFFKSGQEKLIQKISINTSSNDHMPFIYGDMLVFSSDRPGGLGGYDLYYSFKTGEGWSEPVNFGPSINSPQDEYRPVVSDHWEFSNRVMIFSSNRPGGLGGFDLYYVGIPRF